MLGGRVKGTSRPSAFDVRYTSSTHGPGVASIPHMLVLDPARQSLAGLGTTPLESPSSAF